MIRKVVLVLAILVVTVVLAQAGDEYRGGCGTVGDPVGARSLDHDPLIPFGRAAVHALPMGIGARACQSRWLP